MSTEALVALSLILDFSGSMDQKLADKSKREILVENMGALASSYKPQDPWLVISFGSGKSPGCGGVESSIKNAGEVEAWASLQKPGRFAKTPLAASIKLLAKNAPDKKIAHALIITDGQDTCGGDFCEALDALDEATPATIGVDLIGYDMTEGEESKLSCSDHKFKHLRFKSRFAKTDLEFADKLQEAQREAHAATAITGAASLEIQHAPANVSFTATFRPERVRPARRSRGAPARASAPVPAVPAPVSWKGPFAMGLPLAGTWEVIARDFEGARAKVVLSEGEHRQADFYSMFHLPPGQLKMEDAAVGLDAAPASGQNRSRNVHFRAPGEVSLAPGRWRIKVDYPYWINGAAEVEIMVEPRAHKSLSLPTLFRSKLTWIDPPAKEAILQLEHEGRVEKLLVLPGSPRVPVPEGAKWRWL
jgi:hypothetical protein